MKKLILVLLVFSIFFNIYIAEDEGTGDIAEPPDGGGAGSGPDGYTQVVETCIKDEYYTTGGYIYIYGQRRACYSGPNFRCTQTVCL